MAVNRALNRLAELVSALAVVLLVVGCSASIPSSPSPATSFPSPVAGSPIMPVSPACESILPTLSETNVQGKLLLQLLSTGGSGRATLEISDPNGANRQMVASVAPDPGSVAVSPDGRLIAFFTSAAQCDGLLVVWGLDGKMVLQRDVPAEVSESFRDALAMRYLAWSPDGSKLACVMNRELYLVDIAQQDARLLVPHREAKYNMAGNVMGSIGHPTWTLDGETIVYSAFDPPEVLSASADHYRTIELVEISSDSTQTLTRLGQEVRILQWTVSPNGRSLLLRLGDERSLSIDLATLETQASTPSADIVDIASCDPKGNQCVSIVSEERERDMLYLGPAQGPQVGDVRLADFGKSTSKCQFQSVLWDADGAGLLATVGCVGQVELWSVAIPGLKAEHLADWQDVESATLISWLH